MTIIKENAPHLRRKATVSRMMIDVLIALFPTLVMSFIVYPINTLIFYALALFIMVACEFVYVGLRNMMPKDGKKHTFKEKFIHSYKDKFNKNNVLSAAVTATIFTLVMPAGAPIYAFIVGAIVGIVFGKLVFGGLGSNIFNPAVVGMVFAKICFGSQYVTDVHTWYYTIPDVAAGATPLGVISEGAWDSISQYSLLDMFFGRIPGTLGEVYKLAIIVGMVYLLIRRSVDWRIIVSYLGTFALLALGVGIAVFRFNNDINPFVFMLYNILSGGLLFGAAFMLTDPVTSPINSPSRVIYGIIAAIFTALIRFFAALPEGVGFSILIANMVAVVLDHYEWSNPRYTRKKIILICCLVVVSFVLVMLIAMFGKTYTGVGA